MGRTPQHLTNNYIHPQVGNGAGGTIEFDPCADKLQILDNRFDAPSGYEYMTQAMELYSRNLGIQRNAIFGNPFEGIALNGVHSATVEDNQLQNNNTQEYSRTGSIVVTTSESVFGPCGDPRDGAGFRSFRKRRSDVAPGGEWPALMAGGG